MAWYFDTSALVKLVAAEPESTPLRRWISARHRDAVTCDLARTELLRAVRRTDPARAEQARNVLNAVDVVQVGTGVFEFAARLDPPDLRSLDAVHLAAALDLGDDLEGMVTYNGRLAGAAHHHGVNVVAPA